MSKEVKRFYIMPGSLPVLLSGDPAYTPMTNHVTDVHTVPLVLASDYDALLAERDALAEALQYALDDFDRWASKPGSSPNDSVLAWVAKARVALQGAQP